MIDATVLIPTHDHPACLRHAVASVQAQTLQSFELFIVGDGVGDDTRAVVAELAREDARIRFFDCPKGPRKGEINRHAALAHAQGRFVAYVGDDDCWMPHHLEVLGALLAEADFGHTLQVGIGPDGEITVMPADLSNPAFRARMLGELFNRFDLTFAGHTLAAYRRLPHGWRTTPPDFAWTDLYMWRQFLAEPWCRAKSAMVPTAINTWTHQRPHLGEAERAADLAMWRARAADPAFREALWRQIARDFGRQSVGFELDAIRDAAAHAAAAAASGRFEAAVHAIGAERGALETRIGVLEAEQALQQAEWREARLEAARLADECASLKSSTSWRITRPLRAAMKLGGKLRRRTEP
jgi:glycosyltransferase involved in cell wall biosynthesis